MNTGKRFGLLSVLLLLVLTICVSCPTDPLPLSPLGSFEKDVTPNTKRLFNYLSDNYGKNIISGQMDTAWATNERMDMIARVYSDTGKYPALKGFDLLELPNEWAGYGQQQIDEAIEWWEGKNNNTALLPNKSGIHGIIAICWHWRAGAEKEFYSNPDPYDPNKPFTLFRIPWKNNALDIASGDFKTIVNDLDKVAALLQQLKDKDIPVLWRPLHEASGGWFWWGASGPQPYIALWEFMYDYLTNTKGLDNLIWVWNGQNGGWYPDPATVDIVSYDIYPGPKNYDSQKNIFDSTAAMSMENGAESSRMVALSENGAIPDPDKCFADGAVWSWFMVWNDSGNSGQSNRNNFWTGEYHNSQSHKEKVYNHKKVITLDELPDLTKYRLK